MKIGIITVQDDHFHPNRRLIEEGKNAGHEIFRINPYQVMAAIRDGKILFDGLCEDCFPDVVIPRQGAMVGSSSMTLIRHFAAVGPCFINSPEALLLARNKFLTLQALALAGVRVPDTIFVNAPDNLSVAVDRIGGYPVVLKTVNSHQGQGVFLLHHERDIQAVAKANLEPKMGVLIQRFIHLKGRRDFRVLVIGDRVAGAMELFPGQDDFRSNYHINRQAKPAIITVLMEEAALRSARALDLEIAGVDFIQDAQGSHWVLEVNYSPGFHGLETVTGDNIAAQIIQYAQSRGEQHKDDQKGHQGR